jgi:hypothetical protein
MTPQKDNEEVKTSDLGLFPEDLASFSEGPSPGFGHRDELCDGCGYIFIKESDWRCVCGRGLCLSCVDSRKDEHFACEIEEMK